MITYRGKPLFMPLEERVQGGLPPGDGHDGIMRIRGLLNHMEWKRKVGKNGDSSLDVDERTNTPTIIYPDGVYIRFRGIPVLGGSGEVVDCKNMEVLEVGNIYDRQGAD